MKGGSVIHQASSHAPPVSEIYPLSTKKSLLSSAMLMFTVINWAVFSFAPLLLLLIHFLLPEALFGQNYYSYTHGKRDDQSRLHLFHTLPQIPYLHILCNPVTSRWFPLGCTIFKQLLSQNRYSVTTIEVKRKAISSGITEQE